MAKPAKLVLLADTLLALYRQMLRIRRCDQRLVKSFHEGWIPGDYFSCFGQEAIYVGVCHHLRREDVVLGTHRGQGQALAKGMPLVPLMAELYGRAAGCAGGRAGAYYLCDPYHGLLGTSGIAGASLLQAVGASYTFRLLGQQRAAVCFFGEGAALCGAFHEALNLAALWQLPVLLVCESNQFVGRTDAAKVMSSTRIANRARTYEMPGIEVDGNDVTSVYAAAFEAIRRAREGKGPTLLECVTSRRRSHAEGDIPTSEPEASELQRWAAKDPIDMLGERLISSEFATSAELAAFDAALSREVDAAHQEALASPFPTWTATGAEQQESQQRA